MNLINTQEAFAEVTEMKKIIETESRVFEVTITPDTPGRCVREATLTQLSGIPLTNDDWYTLLNRTVAQLVSDGFDVVGWGAREEP